MRATKLANLLITAAFLLAACNIPLAAPPEVGVAGAALTSAAQTVQAQLLVTVPPPAATLTPLPGLPTNTPAPTNTFIPPATATSNCNIMDFISDITVPDGKVMAPSEVFTKTWRIKNIGTCTWTPSYAVVFDSGSSMSGPATQALTGNVNPGQTVDISVNLTAPASNGDYTGHYRLRDGGGVLFGKFYVQIKVQPPGSSGYDFHTRATSASWVGSAGAISFGGPDTDPNGFAMYRDGQLLEDGTSPAKILEMHPQWVDNGVMTGIYSNYLVVSGDHFKARIGFLAFPDGSCGVGNATFQLSYSVTGNPPWTGLGSWNDSCNGSTQTLDLNLSGLVGQNVHFALAILANGSSGQDWAVWVRPRIEGP